MLVSDEVRQLSDANELRRYGPGFPLILNDQWKVWRSHENYFSGRCHHPSYCRPRLGPGMFMVKVSVAPGHCRAGDNSAGGSANTANVELKMVSVSTNEQYYWRYSLTTVRAA